MVSELLREPVFYSCMSWFSVHGLIILRHVPKVFRHVFSWSIPVYCCFWAFAFIAPLISASVLFCFFVSVSPHFAITASTLLGGSLLCPCPVCNGSSTNPPSGNCSFPPSFISSEPPSNTPFCQNRLRDSRVKTLQTFWNDDSTQCWLLFYHMLNIVFKYYWIDYFTLWYKDL